MLLLFACEPSISQKESLVRDQLESVLELHSYEYLYREILYFGEQETVLGFIPTRDRRFLFRVDFRVSAGVDLSEGFEIDSSNSSQIHIRLPEPEILSIDAQESSIRQYLNQSFGGELQYLEISDLLEQARESLAEDATRRGILAEAKREAEALVRTLLSGLGIQNLSISWGLQDG